MGLVPVAQPRPSLMIPTSFEDALVKAELCSLSGQWPASLKWAADRKKEIANAMQIMDRARQWGLSPYVVAGYAYFIDGKLQFHGTLIAAVVNNSGLLTHDLDVEFAGEGPNMTCTVSGTLKRNGQYREHILEAGKQKTKNMMWDSDPKLKLYYNTVRAFANLYLPQLVVGFPDYGEEGDTLPTAVEENGSSGPPPPKWGEVTNKHAAVVLPTTHTFRPGQEPASDDEMRALLQLTVDLGLTQHEHRENIRHRFGITADWKLTSLQAMELRAAYEDRLKEKRARETASAAAAAEATQSKPEPLQTDADRQTLQEALMRLALAQQAAIEAGKPTGFATNEQVDQLIAVRESYFGMKGMGDAKAFARERESWWKSILDRYNVVHSKLLTAVQAMELLAKLETAVARMSLDAQTAAQAARTAQSPPATVPPAKTKS
jgi:hypothetical protein